MKNIHEVDTANYAITVFGLIYFLVVLVTLGLNIESTGLTDVSVMVVYAALGISFSYKVCLLVTGHDVPILWLTALAILTIWVILVPIFPSVFFLEGDPGDMNSLFAYCLFPTSLVIFLDAANISAWVLRKTKEIDNEIEEIESRMKQL